MEAVFIKTLNGLIPANPPTEEWLHKVKIGRMVRGKFTQIRNSAFHRKYFALVNMAFDNWEPGEIDSKYGVPEKNFERFRHDLTILAGFYDVTIRLDGSTRIEPKSISFAKMDQDEFEKVYSKTIDVLIKHVYSKLSKDEINTMVERYLEFA